MSNSRKNKNSRRFAVLFTLMAFLAFSAAGLSACSITPGNGSDTTSPASAVSSTDSSSVSDPVVSGTLRLWMQQPATLHPLVSTQYQWQAISKLVYEGLYEVDSEQDAVPDLADDYYLAEDGLAYIVYLKKDVLFHDNSVFDAADVLATVQYIQNPANQSIYLDSLSNVTEVTVVDSNTVRFKLAQPDPFFLYELSFPILSSDSVSNPQTIWQPGTGPYQVTSYEKGNMLGAALFTASRKSADFKIQSIAVLELKNTTEAMEAFGDDRVDIVLLRDAAYETYYLRNDVKIVRYPGTRYLFFEMNQGVGRILSDPVFADYTKLIAQDPALMDGIRNVFCTSNRLPFLGTSPLVHLNQCKDILTIEKTANPYAGITKKLMIVYPLNDTLKEMLITRLKIILDREGVAYTIKGYEPSEYAVMIQSGNYDLALREATLTSNPDPSWLFLNLSLRKIIGLETLKKGGTAQFMTIQTELARKYMLPETTIAADEFCGILNQAYRYGPFIGVGFRIDGVMQSKRIQGQLDPNSFNQYNNLEEVWVWSGQ